MHAEVLEHVPDWQALLRETRRLLRRGGSAVFTAPFLADRERTTVRAQVVDGAVRHLLPPELHGAPLQHEGVLVFQVPGWDLLPALRDAGFSRAWVGWLNDPDLGLTGNNSAFDNHMEPVVFRAQA